MDNSKALGTEPVSRLLLKYSTPAVLGMLVQILYTIVDTIFIGHFVGNDGLAAVTLVFPIVVFSSGFGMLVGVGACSYIALLLGQRRLDEAEKTLGNAFSMILIFTLTMTLVLLVAGNVYVNQTDTTPEIRAMAKTFLSIAIATGIIPAIMFGLNNIVRVQGNPNIAMGVFVLGSILNAVFNPIFVGWFQMGVAGSAWATALAQTIAMCWVLRFFLGSNSLLKLRTKNLKLDWSICKPVLTIGLAPFITQSVASLQGMLLMHQLTTYGDETALAVWGVIYRAALVIFMVVLGIYQGAQPILGYNYSARQFDRVRQTFQLAILVSSIWCVIAYIPIMIFPNLLVRIFTELTPRMAEISTLAVRCSLGMMLFLGFQVVSSHYFQAVGKPYLSLFLSMTRQVIFLIPLLVITPRLMVYFHFPAITGIWAAFLISDTMSCLLTAYFYRREILQLISGKVKISILRDAENPPDALLKESVPTALVGENCR
ncbi:MAG: MATE family efflux transporter [Planctomycetia bacterium]|nr:MATE family efflux transporter [Planctomycetia bacterium]